METVASRDVPDGKELQVRVRHDGSRVTRVTLRGDFFLEPPAALERVERALADRPVDAPADSFADAVAALDADCIGFSADDVGAAVRAALDDR